MVTRSSGEPPESGLGPEVAQRASGEQRSHGRLVALVLLRALEPGPVEGLLLVVAGEQPEADRDAVVEAHAGDFLFGPRDIPHRYVAGAAGCRMLFILTPGGFEDLVVAMSRPAAARTLPPPSTEEPDWARVAAIAQAHGAELLG